MARSILVRAAHAANLTLLLGSLWVGGCASVPSLPPDFPHKDPGAREHAESLRESVQAIAGGWGNFSRRSAALERIEAFGLEEATTTEWIDWFSFQTNVLIEIKGTSPKPRIVYLVAHYDKADVNPFKLASILVNGLIDELVGWTFLSEGAIDNASGVAVVLELAKALKESPSGTTYRILLVGAEESGLRGSRAHVAGIPDDIWDQVRLAVNFDCVGVDLGPNAVVTSESNSVESNFWASKVEETAERLKMPLWVGPFRRDSDSDHEPFAATSFGRDLLRGLKFSFPSPFALLPQRSWFTESRRVPTILFSTQSFVDLGQGTDLLWGLLCLPLMRIHGPRDSAARIDPQRLYEVFRIAFEALKEFDALWEDGTGDGPSRGWPFSTRRRDTPF